MCHVFVIRVRLTYTWIFTFFLLRFSSYFHLSICKMNEGGRYAFGNSFKWQNCSFIGRKSRRSWRVIYLFENWINYFPNSYWQINRQIGAKKTKSILNLLNELWNEGQIMVFLLELYAEFLFDQCLSMPKLCWCQNWISNTLTTTN